MLKTAAMNVMQQSVSIKSYRQVHQIAQARFRDVVLRKIERQKEHLND